MLYTRLTLLFTVITWGWTFVATKVCLTVITPVEILGLRMLLGLPALGLILWVKGVNLHFSRREHAFLWPSAAVVLFHFLVQLTGLKYTTATNTSWLISVTPLILALLSYVFLRERLGSALLVGLILATMGILLLVSHGNFSQLAGLESHGDWLALLSAHTWAVYTILTRNLSRTKNPLAVAFATLLPGALLVNGYLILSSDWGRYLHLPAGPAWSLLFLALPGLALAHWFWQQGVAKIGAARAGVYLYLEPVATTALALPLLGEPLSLMTVVGGGLVLLGVFLAQKEDRHSAGSVPSHHAEEEA
jgi:drug/metabolite transporter (DMT)-like permease